MIAALLIMASSGLSSPNWPAGLEHFGCAAYIQKVWTLTDVQRAQVEVPEREWEEPYLQHIKLGRGLLIPVVESVDPTSEEASVVSRLVRMPVKVGSSTVVDALLTTILQSNDLKDELAETKSAGPVEVARFALARYDAQECKSLLETVE